MENNKESLIDRISAHLGIRDQEINKLQQQINDERSCNHTLIVERDRWHDEFDKAVVEKNLCFENFSTVNKELQAMKSDYDSLKKERDQAVADACTLLADLEGTKNTLSEITRNNKIAQDALKAELKQCYTNEENYKKGLDEAKKEAENWSLQAADVHRQLAEVTADRDSFKDVVEKLEAMCKDLDEKLKESQSKPKNKRKNK